MIACWNPLLAEERARKRRELLASCEKRLEQVRAATQRAQRPLRGKDKIALAVGRALGRYRMSKHSSLFIEEDPFTNARDEDSIAQEAALDGIYVLRTSVAKETLSAEAQECGSEGPAHPSSPGRPRARSHPAVHAGLLCGVAHQQALTSLLFADEEPEAGEALGGSIVAPAQRSPAALHKVHAKLTQDGFPVHSFQTLMQDLATLTLNQVQAAGRSFLMISTPTPLRRRAFELLSAQAKITSG